MKADKPLKNFSDFFELASGTLEEIATLGLLIKDSDSSVIAFAIYRGVANREMAVEALKERLNLPVAEFTLSSRQKNPVKFIHEVPFQERGCVFFFGLEDALPDAAGYLNLQREYFAEVPHAVVFWVSEYGLREIANQAPDFWAWRSGVFDFRTDAPPMVAMRPLAALPLIFRDREDLERRISLYQELLQEHSRQDIPDHQFLAGLHQKLATAFFNLGKLNDAETHAREGLELSRKTGKKYLEAAALLLLSNLAEDRGNFDEAENCARQALETFTVLGFEEGVAGVNHQLGIISQERHQFDQAEVWYKNSLEITKRLGLERDAAGTYHQLGILSQERYQLEQAEAWYKRALEIFDRLGLERYAAATYHQLGNLAQERYQLEQAEAWYQKALEIKERLGLERDAAGAYHELGRIAEERQQLEQAEAWYQKALEIRERLGLERDAAGTYHQLGRIAEERQQLEQAEAWYQKALQICERLTLEQDAAKIYHQLGIIDELRQQLEQAEVWYQKALEIKKRLGLERDAASDYFHLGTIAQKREQFDKAEALYIEALNIAERLRHSRFTVLPLYQLGSLYFRQNRTKEAIKYLSRGLPFAIEFKMKAENFLVLLAAIFKTMEEDKFKEAWQQATPDQEPPLEVLREISKTMDEKEK